MESKNEMEREQLSQDKVYFIIIIYYLFINILLFIPSYYLSLSHLLSIFVVLDLLVVNFMKLDYSDKALFFLFFPFFFGRLYQQRESREKTQVNTID